ncbi:hypothetical protein LINPERHAP1_LOCUS18351 [Linum perenne]
MMTYINLKAMRILMMAELVVPTRAWALEHKLARIPLTMWPQFVDLRLRNCLARTLPLRGTISHPTQEVRRSCGLEGFSW